MHQDARQLIVDYFTRLKLLAIEKTLSCDIVICIGSSEFTGSTPAMDKKCGCQKFPFFQ